MQTKLPANFQDTADGRDAESILRTCVHCGFCTATCPTYQLSGDELDGPRGRIYLIKQMLESGMCSGVTQLHLDRCLNCRACETACPSGVRYTRLLDIGRAVAEQHVRRPRRDRAVRFLITHLLPYQRRAGALIRTAVRLRPLLPSALRERLPARVPSGAWPRHAHARTMLVLPGCVQRHVSPVINAAAARVLDRLGINLVNVAQAGCCGALSYHTGAQEDGRDFMRGVIDACWPHIERGAEAIVMTASGCGATVKEYGELLRHDARYAERAARVSALAKDLAEILAGEQLNVLRLNIGAKRLALHTPCTLHHAQRLGGVVESLLQRLGFALTPVADAHLCCGSAGTYSLLQPALAEQLRYNKLAALQRGAPTHIVTANIGCQLHLASRAAVPVQHWIELVDAAMA